MDQPEPDDPKSWSIDRVIYELCQNNSPPWSMPNEPAGASLIPDRHELEPIFRKNHIDGETLLALRMEELRDELGVPSYGQRRAVLKVIGFLGQKYIVDQKVESYLAKGLATPEITHSRRSPFGQSPAYDAFGIQPSIEPQNTFGSPLFAPAALRRQAANHFQSNSIGRPVSYPPHVSAYSDHSVHHPFPYAQSEQAYHSTPQLPPPTYGQFTSSKNGKTQDAIGANKDNLMNDVVDMSSGSNNDAGYLDVLDTSIDRTLNRKTASPFGQLPNAAPRNVESTELVAKPKKRVAPTWIAEAVTMALPPPEPPQEPAKLSLNDGYLVPTTVKAEDIISGSLYDEAIISDSLDDDETNFELSQSMFAAGLRIIVARCIAFIYQQPQVIQSDDALTLAQRYVRYRLAKASPRQRRAIIKAHAALDKATVMEKDSVQTQATRQSGDMEAVNISMPSPKGMIEAQEAFKSAYADDGGIASLDQYQWLLDKYPPIADDDLPDDDILPQYGDSGDENEYDDATWKEIEEERKDDVERSKHMTPEEVSHVIEEALAELHKSWQHNKLPKVHIKAYNLWLRAARYKRRQIPLKACQEAATRARQTLAKFRQAITDDKWQKIADVKTQCQSLEMKLFEALENEYFVQVLQEDEALERPVRGLVSAKPQKRPAIEDDEETIGSDSEVALDDFVVDDAVEEPPDDPMDEDFNPIMPASERRQTKQADQVAPRTRKVEENQEEPLRTPIRDDLMGDSADEGDIEDTSENVLSPRTKNARKKRQTPHSSRRHQLQEVPERLDKLEYSDSDSDLDAGPRLPKTKYRNQGYSEQGPIDLTFSSDGLQDPTRSYTTTDFEVVTPELNPIDASNDIDNQENKDAVKLKLQKRSTTKTSPGVPKAIQFLRDGRWAKLDDVKGICKLSWEDIEGRSDHQRAVRKRLYHLEHKQAADLEDFIGSWQNAASGEAIAPENVVKEGMQTLKNNIQKIEDVRPRHQEAAREFVKLYLIYVCCRDVGNCQTISEEEWNKAFEQQATACGKCVEQIKLGLDVYLQFLERAPQANNEKKRKFAQADEEIETMDNGLARLSVTPGPSNTGTDSEDQIRGPKQPPHKKRKRPVAQSQEALAQQQSDQQRIKEQEKRRAQMEKKLGSMAKDDTARHPVNVEEPYVYLNSRIALRIKPHQLDGLRFLWREIVGDPKRQGCLLAHTMGLGKTMQVVSLLVTIAECTQSQDPVFQAYIPPSLRPNRTLILCPPSLLENWEDELAMWTPKDNPDLLGTVRKIKSGKDLGEIEAWAGGSGILLLSYTLFQRFVDPKKALLSRSSEITKETVQGWLLESPSLVVADEAHNMKNVKAKVSLAASQFKTLSRIALTGSPLNNHLEEYHTMIDWVAPGYLGTMVQFKSKYSEPIIQGLYADSSAHERRLCLKKLHVLKRDLEPKVNRADISAIQKDMPPKTEFFITIPLTDIQRRAYDTYIHRLLEAHEPVAMRSKLLAWLGDLLLLCNHPSAFVALCDARSHEQRTVEDTGDEAGESEPDTKNHDESEAQSPGNQEDIYERLVPVSKKDMTAMEAAAATLENVSTFGNLDDFALSNRTLIVAQIVQKAAARGDKTLIFSHSIYTLNMLQTMLEQLGLPYDRIDGTTKVSKRQQATKMFNSVDTNNNIFLISTKAGGLGLNLQGASRVILFDFNFNPMWEEQAVGRAYRLGQRKPVYVYRFRTGGTCEEVVNNKAVFKSQLFRRVVDKKNPERYAKKSVAEYLFPSREIDKEIYDDCLGKDDVLDGIIEKHPDVIRNIELTETFQKEDDEKLTEEDLKAANEEFEDERLRREDPMAWQKKQLEKHRNRPTPVISSNHFPNGLQVSQAPVGSYATGPTAKKAATQQYDPNEKITVPAFRPYLVKTTNALIEKDNEAKSPSKMPQTDGSADEERDEAPSSGEEAARPPDCKTQ